MNVGDDCIIIIRLSGKQYADMVKAIPRPKIEEFPRLNTHLITRIGQKAAPKAPKVAKKAKVAITKARTRTAKVGPLFEVTVLDDGWQDVRKSIEQKIKNPKVRSVRSRNGLIQYPEHEEAAKAL